MLSHRWFGPSSRCRSVWSVRTLSTRQGKLCGPHVGDLTGLSQYPVFKVQAQRGVTLRANHTTVNDRFRAASNRIRRPGKRKRPRLDGGAAGDVMRHRCDTDTSIRLPPRERSLSRLRSNSVHAHDPSRGANQDSTRHRGAQQRFRSNIRRGAWDARTCACPPGRRVLRPPREAAHTRPR
jgi:hypothetical protein